MTIDKKNKLALRIKELRKKLGYAQADMAAILGIHLQTFSRYERGELIPSAESLSNMTKSLNANANWLLIGEGPMFIEGQGSPLPVTDLAARSPAYVFHRQLDRIVAEGDKKKIEGLNGMLKALDPGESPSEGVGEGEDAATGTAGGKG